MKITDLPADYTLDLDEDMRVVEVFRPCGCCSTDRWLNVDTVMSLPYLDLKKWCEHVIAADVIRLIGEEEVHS